MLSELGGRIDGAAVSPHNVSLLFWERQEHCHFLDVTLGDEARASGHSGNCVVTLTGCLVSYLQQLTDFGGPSKSTQQIYIQGIKEQFQI